MQLRTVPGAFGAYPAQRETPYWENPALRMSKGKIYSQSTGKKYIHKMKVGVKHKIDKKKAYATEWSVNLEKIKIN